MGLLSLTDQPGVITFTADSAGDGTNTSTTYVVSLLVLNTGTEIWDGLDFSLNQGPKGASATFAAIPPPAASNAFGTDTRVNDSLVTFRDPPGVTPTASAVSSFSLTVPDSSPSSTYSFTFTATPLIPEPASGLLVLVGSLYLIPRRHLSH